MKRTNGKKNVSLIHQPPISVDFRIKPEKLFRRRPCFTPPPVRQSVRQRSVKDNLQRRWSCGKTRRDETRRGIDGCGSRRVVVENGTWLAPEVSGEHVAAPATATDHFPAFISSSGVARLFAEVAVAPSSCSLSTGQTDGRTNECHWICAPFAVSNSGALFPVVCRSLANLITRFPRWLV